MTPDVVVKNQQTPFSSVSYRDPSKEIEVAAQRVPLPPAGASPEELHAWMEALVHAIQDMHRVRDKVMAEAVNEVVQRR